MASLLDIGPLTEDVPIKGVNLTVSGVSAGDLFYLIGKFPDIAKLMSGASGVNPEALMRLAPDAIANILAIATGNKGDNRAIKKARQLGVTDQLTLINVIFRLTFSEGTGPFVEQLNQFTKNLGQSTTVSDTTSVESISASLLTDIPPLTRGDIHRAN